MPVNVMIKQIRFFSERKTADMKKSKKLSGNFPAVLLVFVLCFTAALTVSADMDTDMAEIAESIRSEYGDEAAAGFEKMMDNDSMKAFAEALQKKLEAEFPGMSGEEIHEKLENMPEEESMALMESIFNDPEILKLSETVSEDEELAGEMEALMEMLSGDESDTDEAPKLEKPVSGTQGDNISWKLDTDGILTISGSGQIVPFYEEFEGTSLPFYRWDDYIDFITGLVIKDGVTAIPGDAFSFASALKTAVIPASAETIGSEVFAGCENLTDVYFQGDAPEIAADAFDGCSKDLTLHYREGTEGTEETSGAAADSSAAGIPGTGDADSIWPFVILLAASVICGAAVIIRMRRKDR